MYSFLKGERNKQNENIEYTETDETIVLEIYVHLKKKMSGRIKLNLLLNFLTPNYNKGVGR